jgi:hypothetical protein
VTGDDPSHILTQGAEIWNAWRERNPGPVTFSAPRWYDSPGPGGAQIKGRNRIRFDGLRLSDVSIYNAFAEGLHLRYAVFDGAHFEEGDFSRADFSGATFRNEVQQDDPHDLSNHRKMRDTLTILNDRGVLLLGRFKDGGLERLYSMREWLQRKGYTAMIFDFARPDNLSLTETVVTMAGLSKFIIVDLLGTSVPAELQSILGQIKKPVLAFGAPCALFPDVADQTNVVTLEGDESNLLDGLGNSLPQLERLHAERVMQLAKRYAKLRRSGCRDGRGSAGMDRTEAIVFGLAHAGTTGLRTTSGSNGDLAVPAISLGIGC